MADGPLDEDIVLSTICILLRDDKKQTKEEEKKRSTLVCLRLIRSKEREFYHQLLKEIPLAKYSLVASQARAKSCRVHDARCRVQVAGYTGDYLCDFVAKISILATFFLRFFYLSRRQFESGCTCDFHLALATRQNLKKSHHLREQKYARVTAPLRAYPVTYEQLTQILMEKNVLCIFCTRQGAYQ